MENQHRKITGYRELSQDEIDLMNEIKEQGKVLHALVNKVKVHIGDPGPCDQAVNPQRWAAMGASDLQTGLMSLTRAVARPEFF